MSPSSPSFPTPFEYILIFYKEKIKLTQKTGEIDVTADEFKKWAYAIWRFPGVNNLKKLGHPASFPVELPTRLIKMLSYQNAIVYDPFIGIGTTAIACLKNKRKFIGSEISSEYVKIAEKLIYDEILLNI